MYKRFLTILCIGALSGLLFFGCGSSGDKTNFPAERTIELLDSVPIPLEFAALTKNVGGEYPGAALHSVQDLGMYSTISQKSINLGIYGADLGYAHIYNSNQGIEDYSAASASLANDLGLGQFFQFQTAERAVIDDNFAELLRLTIQNYEKMNNYLKEQERLYESVLMVVGGWVEGLHISCFVAKSNDSQALRERIAEQKISLRQILPLLDSFKSDEEVVELYTDINALSDIFDKVNISTVEGETSSSLDENGLLVHETETAIEVTVTQELQNQICSSAEAIRLSLVS